MKRKRAESNRTEQKVKGNPNEPRPRRKTGENGKEICGNYKRRTQYSEY